MRILDIRRIRSARLAAPAASDATPAAAANLDRRFFARRFGIVTDAVKRRRDLPDSLRQVLLMALGPRVLPAATLGERLPPERTLRALTERVDYSPAYMCRLAAAAGIRAGRFIDICVALRAVEVITTEGLTLDAAAKRLDFSDASALSGYIRRATGTRPSRMTVADVDDCFDRLLQMARGHATEPSLATDRSSLADSRRKYR